MMGSSRLLAMGLSAALLAGAATAQADSIPPPPACPPGSRGSSSHAGELCLPAPCTTDGDCKRPDTRCRPWRVCTRTYAVPPGGRRVNAPPRDLDLVVGSCAPDKACTGAEEPPPPTAGSPKPDPVRCSEATYCIPTGLPPLPTAGPKKDPAAENEPDLPPSGCCKCHLGAQNGEHGWLLVLGLTMLGTRRRSR